MTDFDDLFDALVGESATRRAPVDLVETRARERRSRERRLHRVQGFVAGAVAVALIVGAVSLARGDGRESAPPAHTGTTTPTTAVTTPTGWTAYDYGLARLSIPPGWTATTGCAGLSISHHLTLVDPRTFKTSCPSIRQEPSILIQPWAPPRDTVHQPFMPTAEVNGFPYELVVPKCLSTACDAEWVNIAELKVTIAFRGDVDMQAVLKTLSYSTYARVLQQPFGPVPASWKSIGRDGYSLRVPRDWKIVALSVAAFCRPAANTVYVGGNVHLEVRCAPRERLHAREDSLRMTSAVPTSARPTLHHNGLVFVRRQVFGPFVDTLTFTVTGGGHPEEITIGLGTDPAIARGILGSLRLAK